MRLVPMLLAFMVAAAVAQRAVAELPIETTPGAAYSVEVWTGDTATARAIEATLRDRARPAGARGQALLRDHADRTIMLLTAWPSAEAAASADASPYFAAAEVYWRRAFSVTGSSAKEGMSLAIGPGSSVQWSEFLMRDPARMDEFAEMVGPITDAMAAGGGAPTLRAVARMRAAHGTSLGLLGLWADRHGFKVFQREGTFGSDPYWAPFADNAHWMMEVVLTR